MTVRSAAEAIASYPERYVGVHFPKNRGELAALTDWAKREGRSLTSCLSEPLPTDDAIRLALRLDGEVWSKP